MGRRAGLATSIARARSFYDYQPVPVPAGATAVGVRLAHDTEAGVIDLGVFAPDGTFRGYSGGARDRFVITASDATPGYLPGPLPAGDWQVLLGLHRVGPAGVRWELEWTRTAEVPAPPPPPARADRPPRRAIPAADGLQWLAGDLHAHTVHSDGTQTIDELAHQARGQGLDFLAVTDHNTVSHHPHLPAAAERQGVTLLPGQEVTTDSGHANCFGAIAWVDFRRPATHWTRHAHDHGGLLSVNHPIDGDCAWRKPLDGPASHVEAWHGKWDRVDLEPLRWWDARGGVPIGGTDVHAPAQGHVPGHPTTWVASTGDAPGALLHGIRDGRTAISAAPDGPVLVRADGALVAVDAVGTRLVPGRDLLAAGDADRCRLGRAVTGATAEMGDATGWHVLVEPGGTVVALSL